jgi:hypothetical protein
MKQFFFSIVEDMWIVNDVVQCFILFRRRKPRERMKTNFFFVLSSQITAEIVSRDVGK